MALQSRYPSFDVMKEKNAWDEHTRQIVTARLAPVVALKFLTKKEARILRSVCAALAGDDTPEVLDFIVGHIDEHLASAPGEGQRKAGVPEAKTLLRSGLRAISDSARAMFGAAFEELSPEKAEEFLRALSQGSAEPAQAWEGVPQLELFQKLLNLTVEAYSSHPFVWSAIGYAGPAYPRGYIRTQLGQLDPWEAQPT